MFHLVTLAFALAQRIHMFGWQVPQHVKPDFPIFKDHFMNCLTVNWS